MSALMRQPAALNDKGTFGFFDDLQWYISPHLWTTTGDTNTTVTITANAVGGVAALNTATATDNDQVMMVTTNATYKFAANCDIEFVARCAQSEANTDDANWAVGLSSDLTTDFLLDNGAGPDTNHSGVVIFKVDGGDKLKCHTSVGATQYTTESVTTANTGTTYNEYKVKATAQGDGNVRTTFFVNDQPLRDSNGRAISHTVTHTDALSMKAGAIVKAGGSNSEVLSVDYIGAFQRR